MFKKNNDILNFLLFFVCFFIVLYSQQNIELSLQIFIPKAVKKHQVANIYYSYRSNGLDFSADRRITFAYDNYSSSTFTIKTKLPNILKLDKIRFDPLSKSGQMTIKNIYLKTGFEKKKLDIGKLYKLGSIAAVRSISNVQLVNNELVISAEGSDSYILLIDEIQAHIDVEQIWLKNAVVSSCLAMIGMVLLYFFHFIVKHKTSSKNFPKKLLLLNNIQPQKTLLFSLSLLALSVLATKTFTSLTALLHFNRDLALADYFFTYITDMGIVVLLSIPAITIALLSQIFASFQFKKNIDFVTIQISLCKMGVEEPFSNKTSPSPSLIRRGTGRLLGFIFFEILFSLCKNILNIAVYLIAIALIALAIFYFVSAYTFYEWGGFVEYQHIEMAAHAEVDAEFFDLIFQWKTLVFTLAFVSLLFITSRIAPSFKQASLLKINPDYPAFRGGIKTPFCELEIKRFCNQLS